MIGIPFTAWLVMLLLGAAHSGNASVPNLGYWVTLALVAAFWLVVSLAANND